MKIEELPSGSYRVRKQINGKRHTAIFDHYPSEGEILLALGKNLDGTPAPKELLIFSNAAKQYVNLKWNVLSPKTRKEYLETPDRLSEEFTSKNIYEITAYDIQAEVNRLSVGRAPKTVENYHSFIRKVIQTFRTDFSWNITLPQADKKEPYIPNDKEVKSLLDYIKKERPDYYVCIVLGAFGLRRSEIMAVTSDDLDGTTLHITKAKVQDENKNWVIKVNKTPKSRRDIEIPQDVADMIRDQGVAFDKHPSGITKVVNTACKRLNINHFSLHKLRHYFASKLVTEKVDIMTVAALGGWSSPAMIYNRYGHAMEDKKKKALKHINKVVK